MTIKGGTGQACAACKYQRRRCSKDCALAPYFPADQPKMFQNAHRLFGVCNIMKILRQVHPTQKDETMMSIIYESNMRAKFPVHGCCGVICHLQYQIQQAIDELRQVRARIAVFKDQFQTQMNHQSLEGIGNEIYPILPHPSLYNPGLMMNQTDGGDVFGNSAGGFLDHNEDHLTWKDVIRVQQHYADNHGINNSNVDSLLMLSNSIPPPQGYQEMEISHDYDEIPFDAIADDRQSYIESKEGCDSASAESTLKDVGECSEYGSREFQNVQARNELRTAAACFSLTSDGINRDVKPD